MTKIQKSLLIGFGLLPSAESIQMQSYNGVAFLQMKNSTASSHPSWIWGKMVEYCSKGKDAVQYYYEKLLELDWNCYNSCQNFKQQQLEMNCTKDGQMKQDQHVYTVDGKVYQICVNKPEFRVPCSSERASPASCNGPSKYQVSEQGLEHIELLQSFSVGQEQQSKPKVIRGVPNVINHQEAITDGHMEQSEQPKAIRELGKSKNKDDVSVLSRASGPQIPSFAGKNQQQSQKELALRKQGEIDWDELQKSLYEKIQKNQPAKRQYESVLKQGIPKEMSSPFSPYQK